MNHQPRLENSEGIFRMWLNWVVSSGALTLLVIATLWIKHLWIPFVAFGLEFLLFLSVRHNRKRVFPICHLLPFTVMRIMFWSGITMLIINGLYSRWLVNYIFNIETINYEIPFITQLIVGPVSVAVILWSKIKEQELAFCRDCKMRHGTPAERGFLGILFTQEGQFQTKLMFGLALFCTLVSWVYYFGFYSNSYFSRLDKYVFIWSPLLLFIAALIYTTVRYIGIWRYYEHGFENSIAHSGRSTRIRFLLVYDNYIGLKVPDKNKEQMIPGDTKIDTPMWLVTKFHNSIPNYDAQDYFHQLSHIPHADIKFAYSNLSGNADCNIFHFIVFLNQEQKEMFDREFDDTHWFTMYEASNLINNHQTNPLLSAEIVRIHTMAMAWKTYHPDGKRRYKIKHYTPTFRLRDLHKWDIDFNDPKWLRVAYNNEDVRFYNLRRFWRKYINGIGD
ncbi:MAG: hypothetical protein K2O88_09345 [Paramuribaculum sp.]|nr:hypothetical protein [Paramuribaculum sp.]